MLLPKAIRWLSAALLAPLAACGMPDSKYFGDVPDDPDPTHLHWCNSGEPEYVDPGLVTSTTGMKLAYAMFDGLTDHNMQGLPEPSLATHWEVEDNQRRFVFHLHDKGRWSNGREIDAYDFAYSIMRILHATTTSRNAGEPLWKIKGGELYTSNRIKRVLRDSGPFKAGDIVEIVGLDGKQLTIEELREATIPDSNKRTAEKPMYLRDQGAAIEDAYAEVPPGDEVTVIEYHHADPSWAYVYYNRGNHGAGVYGYIEAAKLTGQPHGDVMYTVKSRPRSTLPGVSMSREELAAELDMLERIDKGESPEAAAAAASAAATAAAAPTTDAVTGTDAATGTETETGTETGTADELPEPEPQPEPVLVTPPKVATVAGRDLLMLPDVLGVRVPDRYTLILETRGPTPYMIDVSPQRSFRAAPREAVSRRPQRWTMPEHIVTSGPFHMSEWKQRDYIRMTKSPTYWRADEVKLDTITSYNINDQAASANLYYTGHCDAITSNNIPSSYFPVLNGVKRGGKNYADYTAAPYLGIYQYLINNEKLSNVHLRRALNYAVDRSPMPKILHGGQIPTAQFMPGTPIEQLTPEERALCGVKEGDKGVVAIMITGELCYVPPQGLDFDLVKAKEELAIAKKEMGKDFPSKLSLKFNSGVEGHKLIAEYMQDQWQRNLGLEIELEVQEWKTFLKDTANGEYEIARMGWIGNMIDAEAEFLPTFRCDNPDNRTKYCNPEFERLMEEAGATFDRQKRVDLVEQAEKIMIEDAAIIPLYVYTQHHLQKPYVRDLAINLTDQVPLRKAWIDPNWKQNEKD